MLLWSLHLNKIVFLAASFSKRCKLLETRSGLYSGWSSSSEPRFWRRWIVLVGQCPEAKSHLLKAYHVFSLDFYLILVITVAYNICHYWQFNLLVWRKQKVDLPYIEISSTFLQKWVLLLCEMKDVSSLALSEICCLGLLLGLSWWTCITSKVIVHIRKEFLCLHNISNASVILSNYSLCGCLSVDVDDVCQLTWNPANTDFLKI